MPLAGLASIGELEFREEGKATWARLVRSEITSEAEPLR